jgi:outer membrane protein TolC
MPFAAIVLAVIPAFTHLSLGDAQSRALAVNVNVQTAIATVAQRRAALQLARDNAVPHLTGDYSLSPQAGPFNSSTVMQHLVTVGAGVSINDLLTAPAATRAAAEDLLTAQRDADGAVLQARENVTKLYFAALQAIAAEALSRANVAGAQRDRDAAALRARNGESPHLDVVRADVTLAQAQAALAQAEAARSDAVDALASATGVPPASLKKLGGSVPPVPSGTLNEPRAVARALALRPELSALLATIAARRANVTAARETGLPATTVTGGYERGVDSGVGVQGAAVSAHVDLPLASGAGARTFAARAQLTAARAQLLDARRVIVLSVETAIRDARAGAVALRAAVAARDEAARALAAVELGYREGASSSLDVFTARSTYEQAAANALVAQYQQAQALAILEVIVP